MGKAKTKRFRWACELCHRRGVITMPARIDGWTGMMSLALDRHSIRSPRCYGGSSSMRITKMPAKQ